MFRDPNIDDALDRFAGARSLAEGESFGVQTLIPNEVTTFGIGTLHGYDAAIPNRLHMWGKNGTTLRTIRLFGARYVVLAVKSPGAPDNEPGVSPIMDPLPGARLYTVGDPLPRVYLAAHTEVADDTSAIQRSKEPDVLGGETALLAPDTGPIELGPALERAAPGRPGSCEVAAFSNRHISARCRATAPALAVFIEQHAPGWRARVDGRDAPLLRANVLMRAVELGPGEHRIDLDYAPPGLAGALAVSLASLIALVLLAIWARRPIRVASHVDAAEGRR
jgi:hypothetical protein